jgi:hypothetical protein
MSCFVAIISRFTITPPPFGSMQIRWKWNSRRCEWTIPDHCRAVAFCFHVSRRPQTKSKNQSSAACGSSSASGLRGVILITQ